MEAQEIINQISRLAYSGIFILSLISNIFVPFPEEIILVILGYLSAGPKMDFFMLLPIMIAGLVISDSFLYFLARKGNKLITKFYEKLFAGRVESRMDWVDRHMSKIIFFSRFLLQLRFLGPFLAGQKKVPYRKFLGLSFLAITVNTSFYLFLGWFFRGRIDRILGGIGVVHNIFLAVILVLVIVFVIRFIYRFIKRNELTTSRISRIIYKKFLKKDNE